MRDNRERWQFYSHPSKPALSSEEMRYWKATFEKTLKVGLEFEFNLPEGKGQCRGDNISCPCSHIEENCWLACANIQACKSLPNIETCSNKAAECTASKCKKCDKYDFRCIGVTCVDFISACFACDKFERNCDTCKDRWVPDRDPKNIRDQLSVEFNPSKHYGKVSETGVVNITTDGSLLGDKGIEIITVGRRVDYWEFYKMSKRIIDRVQEYGGYINERTSTHMHVLTAYYENVNELEKPAPEIIAANFHQLVRRYQNALTWLTIALDDPSHMTRWEKFRISILGISPVTRAMNVVASEIHKIAGNKYGFVNYDNMSFLVDGSIDKFHVEFRQSDAAMCPSFYAAMACLHYAFVIKAIEISRHGLLKVGDEKWLDNANKMKSVILNGTGDWNTSRVSDTSKLLNHKEYFISESLDMLSQMKNILIKIGPAYDVLLKLANNPIAIRRVEGKKWEDIEEDLAINVSDFGKIDLRIEEVIDLRLIDECKSLDEWIEAVYSLLMEDKNEPSVEKEYIRKYASVKMKDGEAIWSESTGCLISI